MNSQIFRGLGTIFRENMCEILHIRQGLHIYIKCLRTCLLYSLLNLVIQLPFCSCRFSLGDNIYRYFMRDNARGDKK